MVFNWRPSTVAPAGPRHPCHATGERAADGLCRAGETVRGRLPTPAPASGPAQPTGGFWSNLMSHLTPSTTPPSSSNVTDPHLPTGEFLKNWQTESQALKDKAEASAQQGDYVGAAAHGINFLANMVPGLGKAMDDAAEGIRDATTDEQVRAHLGRLAAIAAPLAIANAAPETEGRRHGSWESGGGVVTKPGTGRTPSEVSAPRPRAWRQWPKALPSD